MLKTSSLTKREAGDFVFYRPKQGDALLQFRDMMIRHGKISVTWKPIPERF
ncbi:MAG: hypothetical protein QHH74_10610 [Spirochaetota bacterium]|nr:hypothetical protein [Spirochaetota bacterium]